MDDVLRRLGDNARRSRFDRMETVVDPKTRVVQPIFIPVAKYYGAKVVACPPPRGNRKGSMEKFIHFATQLVSCEAGSTICCLCGGRGVDGEVAEKGLHLDADLLVVPVDGSPDGGLAAEMRAPDAGEDRRDDVVAEGDDARYGPGGLWRDLVAAGSGGFVDELFASELA
jgi:hypothetical protein